MMNGYIIGYALLIVALAFQSFLQHLERRDLYSRLGAEKPPKVSTKPVVGAKSRHTEVLKNWRNPNNDTNEDT